jgi:ribonuclease HII
VSARYPFPDLTQERALWRVGHSIVGGIDEAGRGTWAGPVFAAVVVLSPVISNNRLLGNVRDSKQMTARQRQKWAQIIKESCLDWGVGKATNKEVDRLGIVLATHLAARRALKHLKAMPDFLLLDYLKLEKIKVPQRSFIHGDQQVLSIAAASVIAKTSRDDFMIDVDRIYPLYLFRSNKGYGTAAHQQALQQHGICPIHRLSFKPVMAIKNALPGAFDRDR